MTLKSLLSALLFVAGATAQTSPVAQKIATGKTQLCGTQDPTEQQKMFSKMKLDEQKANMQLDKDPFTVDVYFNVVTSSNSTASNSTARAAYVSDENIAEQIRITQRAYAPHGISFNFISTNRTVNDDWASGRDIDGMKAKLRQGSYADLNVYAVENIGNGVLGFCPFPEQVAEGDDTFLKDGCTIMAGTMPGGDTAPYNKGGTLVHEIGHWMDVYHTFQDGCFPGDRVDDTPAQRVPGRECNPNKVYDTCPNDPGTDPIFNWMNYTGDGCWEEFTPGQEERMYNAWKIYRKPAA